MISIRHLFVRSRERDLLADVCTEVANGELLGVIGPPEAGKTLCLKAIAGLVPIAAGEIWADGARVDNLTGDAALSWQRQIGMAFQNDALFDGLSVFENVAFPLRRRGLAETEIRDRVSARLADVGLSDAALKLPRELSGGMQKRVGVARATVVTPAVALFDEPVAGLDPVSACRILDLIALISCGKDTATIIVCNDLPAILPLADRVLMLKGGETVYDGRPADLATAVRPEARAFATGRELGAEG
ncbi:MAG: ATP-binding cassette domain-containing protein [Deltaproteobacteria bacterium]|nr:ATP-binding cassette domain-containing protein [Deltaproteobacteria bacterium]